MDDFQVTVSGWYSYGLFGDHSIGFGVAARGGVTPAVNKGLEHKLFDQVFVRPPPWDPPQKKSNFFSWL